ncbi:hypothetical protein SNE40_020453 [Patella caerulea]|uniref:Uncharacterized protein n=1 Tax=Patella caerulea TaxID=87958 RepID=A0AAN8G4D4_PATCE
MKTIFTVFLLISTTTGFSWYSCTEPSLEHNIFCEDGDRINIMFGQYGFKYSECSRNCSDYSDYCDCNFDFNRTVDLYLKNWCNGKETCNFKTPDPYYGSCYKNNTVEMYNDYAYSYIEFECLTVTTTLAARRTTTTREPSTTTLPTSRTTSKREPDNSRPLPSKESSIDKDRSGRKEAVLYSTDINNAKAVHNNQDTSDMAVIVGSVMGCILLVILVFIAVVFIFKRKTVRALIAIHSKPAYEAPSDGYNNAVFKTDNSTSVVNMVKSDDYNYLPEN